ncbi:MAG: XRE family transcriptional regulator [Eubacteriales bacterium]|nr:XRE family transcriptional regulator [Eubacteriales bacterium]
MTIGQTVSQNARCLREAKRLTLDAAAAVTGVSRSMLAQIEKGDVNPTLSVLWKIANGYKVSFSSLIEGPRATAVVVPPGEPLSEDEGRYVNYPAFPFDEQRLFETYRIVMEPGACLRAEAHLAGTEEYVTVFDGEAAITASGETFALREGDSLRFRADTPHCYENPGSVRAQLSMLIYYAR